MTTQESKSTSGKILVHHTWHGRAFILEILVVMVFIIVSMAILAQVFAAAKSENEDAVSLSYAVMIATNEAELFASHPNESVVRHYRITGAGFEPTETPDVNSLSVSRTVTPVRSGAGTLYEASITVTQHDEAIYGITSARYTSDTEVG